ncbi:hypothetical protein HY230_02550 [Candidatus Acetothermia bacterium]|nr:hypothetical protein [Candidatus Acetothermia bacterium]
MRIHVLYDSHGNIISLGVPLPPAFDFRGPTFGPRAKEGQQYATELEVPEEHVGLGLIHLAEKLQVDTKGKQLRLISKRE